MYPTTLKQKWHPRLSSFIQENKDQILVEWENFARTRTASSRNWTEIDLRDHGQQILSFIAEDMDRFQSAHEQSEKSKGRKKRIKNHTAAEVHAAMRLEKGFNIQQMVSEYRALRASIMKLWSENHPELHTPLYVEIIRFNEAVDQNLMESVSRFSELQTRHRDLVLGVLGHDIRTPLGAILMSAQLLKKPSLPKEKAEKILRQIESSSLRIKELVGNLLDLTRINQGSGIVLEPLPFDMSELVSECLKEVQSMHPGSKLDCEIKGDTKGRWDKARIAQVLTNLLSNAIQYGDSSRPITVLVKGDPAQVVLAVRNEGKPIPEDNLSTIFNSFTRADNKRNATPSTNNLGLGLYIAREIALAHGGNISVSSSLKQGTIFSVVLPRTTQAPAEMAAIFGS
jgi:signal transduction histidine kinase